MKKMLTIALIILAVGVLMFFIAFAASGFDIKKLNSKEITQNDYSFDNTFYDAIVIDSETADVRIVTSDTATKTYVSVSADARRETAVTSEGGVLTVKVDSLPWYKSIGIGWGKEEITVTLPRLPQGDVSIKTTTGDVTLSGIDADGVTVELTTGDVNVNGVSVNNLFVEVTTGDVELDRIDIAGELKVEGTTGDISIEDSRVLGATTVRASTGDVELKLLSIHAGIDIELTTGDVEMDIPSTMSFDVETTTGRKRIPHSDPSAPVCKVRTTTGDISIQYGIDD